MMVCPRCGDEVNQAFYGPCAKCRAELRTTQTREYQLTDRLVTWFSTLLRYPGADIDQTTTLIRWLAISLSGRPA